MARGWRGALKIEAEVWFHATAPALHTPCSFEIPFMGLRHGDLIKPAIIFRREADQRDGFPSHAIAGIEDQHLDAFLLDGMRDAQRQGKVLSVLTAIENMAFASFAYGGFFNKEFRHGACAFLEEKPKSR